MVVCGWCWWTMLPRMPNVRHHRTRHYKNSKFCHERVLLSSSLFTISHRAFVVAVDPPLPDPPTTAVAVADHHHGCVEQCWSSSTNGTAALVVETAAFHVDDDDPEEEEDGTR
jgi:hypothetical protein